MPLTFVTIQITKNTTLGQFFLNSMLCDAEQAGYSWFITAFSSENRCLMQPKTTL